MNAITLKKAGIEDCLLLQALAQKTFVETYAAFNTKENMQTYLNENFSFSRLESELVDTNSSFYLAMMVGEIAGYIKINKAAAQTELKEGGGIEVERIYVLQAFQGKKIGQLLLEKAVELARDYNAAYIWLGVWDQNPKAIRFYSRNGFTAFDKHIFKLGDDEQSDTMMKRVITESAI